MMEQFTEAFREETLEILDNVERLAMDIESGAGSKENLDALFRDFHTIKGSAGMFGFDRLSASAHKLESLLDSFRSKNMVPSTDMAALLLRVKDLYKAEIDGTLNEKDLERLNAELDTYNKQKGKYLLEYTDTPDGEQSFEIHFKPDRNFFKLGGRPHALMETLMALGSITPSYDFSDLPPWDKFDPEESYASYSVILTTSRKESEIREVFDFAATMGELHIDDVTDRIRSHVEGDEARIGDILLARGVVAREDIEEALNQKKLLGEVLVEKHKTSPELVSAALAEQRHAKALKEAAGNEVERTSIKIKASKLDELINIIGEIVTVQSHVESTGRRLKDKGLSSSLEQLGRLTQDLRSISMGLRMVPIGSSFQRFSRLVRDLSTELGKKISFETSGGSTELDKSVIDKLVDPLLHIIRNSIDHGIETPTERQGTGKAEEGIIRLSAQHTGAWVSVRVEDDGRGFDKDKILKKAIERGIADPKVNYSEEAIYSFVMEPGFSTAAAVSEISGRGVGMDVVRRSVRELGGTINLESQKGKGMAITLSLPLTMAIIDGLLFKVNSSCFVLPISAVDRCDSTLDMGYKPEKVILLGDALVPVIHMRQLFRIAGEAPDEERVIYLSRGSRRIALVVDEILGGHQTVIKPLGELTDYLECMNGASILADGRIAFILDLGRLFARVEQAEK